MPRYKLAARWHAYRARTEGPPVPPTPWTGPEPTPHPGLMPVPDSVRRLIARELASC
jgi:hypothetical protein